jgi:hypothetical protein
LLTDESDGGIRTHLIQILSFWDTGGRQQTPHNEHDECCGRGRKDKQLPSANTINDERSAECTDHRYGGIDQVELSLSLRVGNARQ